MGMLGVLAGTKKLTATELACVEEVDTIVLTVNHENVCASRCDTWNIQEMDVVVGLDVNGRRAQIILS